MQVINKINLDLGKKSNPPIVYAMQNDVNSRVIEISLFSDSVLWNVPPGVSASVAFKNTSDGHKGWYDTLPDGSAACSTYDNVVRIILAPAVVSSPGEVNTVIVFQDVNLNQLATFNFSVIVEKNPAADISISNDYYAYSTMEDINEAIDAILNSLEDTKVEIGAAIVCEASGNTISVFDASNRTLQGLTLYGKTTQNGIPTPESPVELVNIGVKNYLPKTEYTAEGTGSDYYFIKKSDPFPTLPAGDYILSFNASTASLPQAYIDFYDATGSKIFSTTIPTSLSTTLPITLPSEATSVSFYAKGSFTITNAMLTKGSICVTIAGKNLFDASKGFGFNNRQPLFVPAGTYITLSAFPTDGTANLNYKIRYTDGTETGAAALISANAENNAWHTATIKAAKDTNGVQIYHSGATNTQRTIGKAMVRIGNFGTTTDADYEPYKESQTLTASTPNGLPGIPVSSGGNYTDENGQQWVCDEIDFARGVYVQRVEILDNPTRWIERLTTNTSGYTRLVLADNALKASADTVVGAVMCSIASAVTANDTFTRIDGIAVDNTNGYVILYNSEIAQTPNSYASDWLRTKNIKVLYALATPIETALPAAELAAYAALHTNKPNTTVLNDAGAGIAIGYVADTKAYIDNKFNELSATLTALTGV